MPKLLNALLALAVFVGATSALAGAADARGRAGSYRVGGYTSHGRGSHYLGGR